MRTTREFYLITSEYCNSKMKYNGEEKEVLESNQSVFLSWRYLGCFMVGQLQGL
jgi:hypothetical protein